MVYLHPQGFDIRENIKSFFKNNFKCQLMLLKITIFCDFYNVNI